MLKKARNDDPCFTGKVAKLVKNRDVHADFGDALLAAALGVVESGAIEVVNAEVYAGMETVARSRIPRRAGAITISVTSRKRAETKSNRLGLRKRLRALVER